MKSFITFSKDANQGWQADYSNIILKRFPCIIIQDNRSLLVSVSTYIYCEINMQLHWS